MRALIIGASRCIGLEFARQYRAEGAAVTATARDAAGLARLSALGAAALAIDVALADSSARLAWQIDGQAFDLAVVNAGIYGPRTLGLQPPSEADFNAVMHANVLGAMRVIPQLVDSLAPGARLALMSSRMGSIGARGNTAGWLYRASKAALNSVLKDVSLALAGKAVCVALHPGYVQTEMNDGAGDLSVAHSVADLRRTIAALTSSDNGRFFDHDGTPIPW